MGSSTRAMQPTDDSQLLLENLKAEQTNYHEGSFEWADLQAKINQIVAERYLKYVNR